MLNCEIHGAQDLRLTEVAPEALGPTQVRVGVKPWASAARTCTTTGTAGWATSSSANR